VQDQSRMSQHGGYQPVQNFVAWWMFVQVEFRSLRVIRSRHS
jgi:hypothetical protein